MDLYFLFWLYLPSQCQYSICTKNISETRSPWYIYCILILALPPFSLFKIVIYHDQCTQSVEHKWYISNTQYNHSLAIYARNSYDYIWKILATFSRSIWLVDKIIPHIHIGISIFAIKKLNTYMPTAHMYTVWN